MLDHNVNVKATLQRFRERWLKVNRSKVRLALSSIPLFGHVLTENRVKLDPAKISVVLNSPTPKIKKELMTFLGLSTYLGVFLPKLVDISVPLHRLTKDNGESVWALSCCRRTCGIRITNLDEGGEQLRTDRTKMLDNRFCE